MNMKFFMPGKRIRSIVQRWQVVWFIFARLKAAYLSPPARKISLEPCST